MSDEKCPEDDRLYKPVYTVEGESIDREGDCGTTPQPPEPDSSSESSETSEGDIRTFTFDELSILCYDIGMGPEMIEGVIAQLLTQHFSDPNWIVYPELKQFVWDKDPAKSKIALLPVGRWNEVVDASPPAIVYSDLGQKPQRIAIGDQYEHSVLKPNEPSFARAYAGAHALMCIGQNDYQASQLASEIERWLTEFSFWLVSSLPFHDFQIQDRKQPQIFSALGNKVGVALTLTYSYIWTWQTTPYGPPLKSASVHYQQG